MTSSLDTTNPDDGVTTLREAIIQANTNPGLDTIEFDIAADDPGHVYYQDDGIAGQVSLGNVATTNASDDSLITDIDPDHAHSWWTIQPVSQLPPFFEEVILDGYTQTGASENTLQTGSDALLRIELDGSISGAPLGIKVQTNDSTVRGLAINGFSVFMGVQVVGDRNAIEGSYIGTDISGTRKLSNSQGIVIEGDSNTVGTNSDGTGDPAERNLISGNQEVGINLYGTSNVIAGNYIGTNASGTSGLGNKHGIAVYDDSNVIGTNGDGVNDLVERNIVSGNTLVGVILSSGSQNTVAGNHIGTDVTGVQGIANNIGIQVYSDSNIVGIDGNGSGDAAERNVISGNASTGVVLVGSLNVVAGNYIGTDATGSTALGNGMDGVNVSGASNIVGTDGNGVADAAERNVISGNGRDGLVLKSTQNIVAGNYLGTDVTGENPLSNGRHGVFVAFQAASNTIGTNGSNDVFNANERNVISANGGYGILINHRTADNNIVAGNYVGTNALGDSELGNALDGIRINSKSSGNVIGTNGDGVADTEERNVFSGNGRYGALLFGDGNHLAGNYIGTDATGNASLGNSNIGIVIYSSSNYIGTDGDGVGDLAERNVVSGNGGHGIYVGGFVNGRLSGTQNVIAGNYVGTDATGTLAIGNRLQGINLDQASNNIIGTNGDGVSDAAERNVISGNGGMGIGISAFDWDEDGRGGGENNVIAGNHIGTDISGNQDLGNSSDGVYIFGSVNRVGTDENGTADADEANRIAFNGANGVNVVDNASFGNSIRGNSIHSNTLLGIDLAGDAVTPNDSGDADLGPNGLQNFPVITDVELGSTTRVVGTLSSEASQQYAIDVYANASVDAAGFAQGTRHLGSFAVTTNAVGQAGFDVVLNAATSAGEAITTTATDTLGNTSEFSRPSNLAPVISSTAAFVGVNEGQAATNTGNHSDPDGDSVVLSSSIGVVVDEGDGTWSWSWTTNDGGDDTQMVIITATDSKGAVSNTEFLLDVLNVAPIVNDEIYEVVENSAKGTLVGTLSASDPGDDTLLYSVSGGTGATAFSIDPITGDIRVLDSAQLDFETTDVFSLEITVRDSDGAASTADLTINVLNQPSLTGAVFVDTDQDGLYDANEMGIDGVVVDLLDAAGGVVFSTVTSDGGIYLFEDLDAGTYQVSESQPSGVDDGEERLGSEGGTVVSNDLMQLSLERTDASDYYFAELGQQVSTGDTATIGFWQNKHGQALIAEGGTQLANWLTDNFRNVFGDEFAGANGEDVAEFYANELFKQKGKKSAGPAKVDAQFMAVAFATFFTSRNLAGSDVAVSYGFHVSDTGIGTRIVNVGTNGAAFGGVADNSDLTIMQLLIAVNDATDVTDTQSGVTNIYDTNGDGIIDADEAVLRSMANSVFTMINEEGDI